MYLYIANMGAKINENIRNIRNSIDIWDRVWYNMGTELKLIR